MAKIKNNSVLESFETKKEEYFNIVKNGATADVQ